MAIQPHNRSRAGVPRSGNSAHLSACKGLASAVGTVIGTGSLSANSRCEKVRVDRLNVVDIRRHFNVTETGAAERAAPLFGGQKAGLRPDVRIDQHIGETVQILEHQFRINRLIFVRPYAFPEYQPSVRTERGVGLVEAEKQILRDMQNVNGVDEIEFTAAIDLN